MNDKASSGYCEAVLAAHSKYSGVWSVQIILIVIKEGSRLQSATLWNSEHTG